MHQATRTERLPSSCLLTRLAEAVGAALASLQQRRTDETAFHTSACRCCALQLFWSVCQVTPVTVLLCRGFTWLGAAELGAVAEKAVISAAELLAKTSSQLQPTVQHLLKLGLHPADVQAMLRNPALRPRNAAHLQQMIGEQGPTLLRYLR